MAAVSSIRLDRSISMASAVSSAAGRSEGLPLLFLPIDAVAAAAAALLPMPPLLILGIVIYLFVLVAVVELEEGELAAWWRWRRRERREQRVADGLLLWFPPLRLPASPPPPAAITARCPFSPPGTTLLPAAHRSSRPREERGEMKIGEMGEEEEWEF
uniref:Uncharacterized protein n=1 Tax=Oryza glumipatula TaxID=40148 RepID=A0A0E0ADZ3_9ORYZ